MIVASNFFSYHFDSIRFSQILEMMRAEGATNYFIQMSHFITSGVMKQVELLSLFQKKQEKDFLRKTCDHVKFL